MTKMDISSWNMYHSVTKVCSVTSKSSLINTFLVVPTSAPLSKMPLAEWICIRPGAPTPAPFFFLDLSSTAARPPVLPRRRIHYADLSGGARARSRVQGCRSSRNHSIGMDPVGELSGFPLVPCPDCGMARVVEGRTQKEGENDGRLYFKCARNSVSSLLCPNLS
jgi:hypothetical protein